jgi:acyl carrier protein phosphodiesterase
MSGVVIDIYFDHLLCCNWHKYSDKSLDSILDCFYAELSASDVSLGGRFIRVKESLVKYKWLHEYGHVVAVHRAFKQIERRLNHRIAFAGQAMSFIAIHEETFVRTFTQFYPELIDYCYSKA